MPKLWSVAIISLLCFGLSGCPNDPDKLKEKLKAQCPDDYHKLVIQAYNYVDRERGGKSVCKRSWNQGLECKCAYCILASENNKYAYFRYGDVDCDNKFFQIACWKVNERVNKPLTKRLSICAKS